jgi:hypothetical protein
MQISHFVFDHACDDSTSRRELFCAMNCVCAYAASMDCISGRLDDARTVHSVFVFSHITLLSVVLNVHTSIFI